MKRALLTIAIALLSSLASLDFAHAQNRDGQGGQGGQGGAGGPAGQSGSEGSFSGRRGGRGGQAGQDGQPGTGFRGGAGGAGGQGGGQMPGPSPIVAAIDENADGEISSSEIESAVESLKSLDRNSDGKLSQDEIRPRGPGRPSERPDEPSAGGEGAGASAGGRGPDQFLVRLMQADQNSDGKLSKDEAPERLQAMFERIDGDSDGFLGKEELQQMAERRREGGPGGPPNARGPGGQPGPGGGTGAGSGGPGGPEAFVDRLFQFDANGDGNLTREELAKGSEQFGAGRRGGDRPEGADGEGRPRRPQRPNDNENN